MMLLALPTMVQAQLTYFTTNGAITITGYKGTNPDVTIPAAINGLPVTSIGEDAFFEDSYVTSVSIPDSVTNVGTQAFMDCDYLTSVYFSGNAPTAGSSAFYSDDLGSDPAAIYYLSSGSGWTNTFDRLPTVMLEGPAQFGTTADGWKYVSDQTQNTLVAGYAGSNTEVMLPSLINGLPVTGIAPKAFLNNTSLASATIPDSVNSIGYGAFWNCTGLTNVMIGNGVTNIGDDAFVYCTSLAVVYFSGNAPAVNSSAFYWVGINSLLDKWLECDAATIYYLSGTLGWSNSFASISTFDPMHDWANFPGLPTVMLDGPPHFATTTDDWSYVSDQISNTLITGHADLEQSVVIPSTVSGLAVTGIAPFAFLLSNLTNVTIPDSVTSIGGGSFAGCSGLTSITIPDSVTSIGILACGPFRPPTDGLFPTYCGSLTRVRIGNGVTNIGAEAFYECYNLTNVTLGKNIVNIGQGAFSDCGSLPSVTIPNSVTSIGDGAFEGSGLTSVTIPDGVTSIADYVFEDCGLTNVTILDSVTSVGIEAFAYCDNLNTVTIGNRVTNIGDLAFYQSSRLTKVYFSGDAPAADSSVFPFDPATIYYLPGTLGWSNTFAGRPTTQWFLPQPLVLSQGHGFGVQSNQFGFTISWATNVPVVVETCTNLANPVWLPASTNTLVGGASYFSDAQPVNLARRFYRLRSP